MEDKNAQEPEDLENGKIESVEEKSEEKKESAVKRLEEIELEKKEQEYVEENEIALEEIREKIGSSSEKGEEQKEEQKEEKDPRQLFEEHRNRPEENESGKQTAGFFGIIKGWTKNKVKEIGENIREARAGGFRKAIQPLLDKLFDEVKVKIVLDMGCGEGEILSEIVEEAKEKSKEDVMGIGLDINDKKPELSEKILKNIDLAFVRGNALESGIESGKVDVVTVFYLLQAMKTEQLQKDLLEEAKRLIKENGRIMIADVIEREGLEGLIDKVKHAGLNIRDIGAGNLFKGDIKYNIKSRDGWKKLLENCGLEIEMETDFEDRSVVFLVKVREEGTK